MDGRDSCVRLLLPQDVKIGCTENVHQSIDLDESFSSAMLHHQQQQQQSGGGGGGGLQTLSSSPPSGGRSSPPSSQMLPTVSSSSALLPSTPNAQQQQHQQSVAAGEAQPLELQLDYWPIIRTVDKAQTKIQTEQSKNSIKSAFRNLQVRLARVVWFASKIV